MERWPPAASNEHQVSDQSHAPPWRSGDRSPSEPRYMGENRSITRAAPVLPETVMDPPVLQAECRTCLPITYAYTTGFG